ncbi:hypothetical protein SAMN05660865_00485 [Caloramator fervidus]|uniref:Uncharacterized protein n=1 Tax=Caloramator fervidus TaxID=29344 RepID=A0A1H5SXB0_9CLOT|nr:hypothetical protein [Caloramator fervidus]SEF55145.1 hypothetical protein SAMN05660865_00485 [Caloramator fervidus]
MVRKSKKYIVGKELPTASKRYKIGPGIDLIDEKFRETFGYRKNDIK